MTALPARRFRTPQIPTTPPQKLTVTRVPPTPKPSALDLGMQHLQQQNPGSAAKILRAAVTRNPLNADAQQMLGMAYHAKGNPLQAIAHMERSLAKNDKLWQWWQNLGIAYQTIGRFADTATSYGAITAFEQAIERDRSQPDPWHNLGTAYIAVARYDEAERTLFKARWMRDQHAQTHFNLGCLYLLLGDVPKSARWFAMALERDPSHQLAHSNLIFCQDLLPQTTAATAHTERRAWNTRHAAALTRNAPPHPNSRNADRKLRVGYIGGDFRDHSAMYSFGPIIERHDPERFEVYIYADVPERDAYTARMEAAATGGFRAVQGWDEARIAGLIREDKIDVLVETAGFTARHKLLVMARRPAPVQMSGWGYLNGTGLDALDGFIVDDVLVPPGDERYFVEQPVYVPHPVGFEPPPDDLPIRPRDQASPPTFGHLGRVMKISSACVTLWADVLKAVPESRLLLKDRGFDPERSRKRILDAFAAHGIDPARIELRGTTKRGEHMDAYNEIDVALDPIPQGGGMTTLEALWMGVPTIALYGPRIVGRVSASHLSRLEIGARSIARSHDEYVQMAKAAIERREKGPWLREALRTSVICDHTLNIRHIENGYRTMFGQWAKRGDFG